MNALHTPTQNSPTQQVHTLPPREDRSRPRRSQDASSGLPGSLGEVFFAAADRLVAGRIDATWRARRSDDSNWVTDVLTGLAPGERAVAAFSFEDDRPAVAHRIAPLPSPTPTDEGLKAVAAALQPTADVPRPARKHWVRDHPDTSRYADLVRDALVEVGKGTVDKVVLGRSVEVLSDPPMTAGEVLHHLAGGSTGAPAGRYLYAVPVSDDATLLGASPELLVRREGSRVEAMPLAGSLPRRGDLDRAGATALLMASAKDRAEHEYVVTDLRARLGELCEEVEVHDIEVVATDSMWHLATRITARLRAASLHAPDGSALALARLVHPTPAVGGVPTRAARQLIASLEPAPRGWFAGAVGWVDASGDGEFALTLRSGLLSGAALDLWAGAGIVAGSDPGAEVAETGAKLSTMTAAVGL